jgi:hypothetical protein
MVAYLSLVDSSLQLQGSDVSPLEAHVAGDFFVISGCSLGREALSAIREGDGACVKHVICIDGATAIHRCDEYDVLGSCPLFLGICIGDVGQNSSQHSSGA